MAGDIKCICGKTFASKTSRGGHYQFCQQWRDYIAMLVSDPEVQQKVKKYGGSKKRLAEELGISGYVVGRWLQQPQSVPAGQSKVASPVLVELTPQQVIQALRVMLEEHAAATKQVAELRAALEGATGRCDQLSQELSERKAELKRVYAQHLEPIRFRLERESIEHQKESH